jgi:hypothetical protein
MEEKKRCPSCRKDLGLSLFYGNKKLNTSKCKDCNDRAAKFVNKNTAIKHHNAKMKIINEFIELNNLDRSTLKFN